MVDLGMTQSKTSLLVGLPPELQGLIFNNLNRHDLNRLCSTCTTIKAVALAKLYKTVVIKAPQRWSRLPSIENLLGSNGDGLKYTTELYICTKQAPLQESQDESEDQQLSEEFLPQSSTSSALNTLVRLIILKLPRNQLELFCWEHSCELNVSTLCILDERQQAKLRTLFCTRNNSSSPSRFSNSDSYFIFGALYSLSSESMDLDSETCSWKARTIQENAETLNHLRLGFISSIAHDFALKRRPQYDAISNLFSNTIDEGFLGLGEVHLSLGSLHLCGLDPGGVLLGEMGFDIDSTKITQLRLESCPELSQAFSMLVDPLRLPRIALGALEDLFIRLEDPDAQFSNRLESFLKSLPGLIHLRVLIDNALTEQNLEPILEIHGKTLRTLVWDERTGPRTSLDASTSLLSTGLDKLKVISRKCRSLTTLGIVFDWEAMASTYRQVIRQTWLYLSRMPYLEALNIRNLPEIKGRPIMPVVYYAKSLAAMVVDFMNGGRKSTLKTIALGAPVYRDIYVGTLRINHNPGSHLQILRVYSIDYSYSCPSGRSPVLRQILEGAAYIIEEESYPKDLLYDYWLG